LQSKNTLQFQAYPILAVLFVLFLVATPVVLATNASSSSSNQGYVTYQVTLTRGTNQTVFVVNESSVPTNQNGFVDITFRLLSNQQNLSYSRVVNTSALPEIFPFIPGITNQSFSYNVYGFLINASISSAGSTSASFNGAGYTGSKYLLDLSATNSSNGQSMSATGNIIALPSGLVYSVQLEQAGNSAISVSVKLLSTNLPLSDPSNTVSTTEGAAMVGAGVLGAAAFAVPFWKLRKKKNSAAASEEADKKPSYWVD
jgi:hypothetical protein